MKSLFETDDGISSEDEDDFDDELSWYQSEPKMNVFSDLSAKQMEVISNLKTQMVLLVKKFEEKMDICGGRN